MARFLDRAIDCIYENYEDLYMPKPDMDFGPLREALFTNFIPKWKVKNEKWKNPKSLSMRGILTSDFWKLKAYCFRLGFLGNQPRSTRFFCSKSSSIDQNEEKAKTPNRTEIIWFSTNIEPNNAPAPATAKYGQQSVPK